MRIVKWLWVLWPAFLQAGVLEMLVFALVDPQDLQWLGQPLELSRQTVYTLGFFMFWGVSLLGSGLTALLVIAPEQVNEVA